jgi:hypothetical protein
MPKKQVFSPPVSSWTRHSGFDFLSNIHLFGEFRFTVPVKAHRSREGDAEAVWSGSAHPWCDASGNW